MKKETLEYYVADLKQGIELGKQLSVVPPSGDIESIVFIGTKESLIYAELLKSVISNVVAMPIILINSPQTSIEINEKTLIIVYADEESYIDIQQFISKFNVKGATLVGCSTNDEFLNWIQVLGGIALPTPGNSEDRIVYPITQILYLLYFYKVLSAEIIDQLQNSVAIIDQREYFIQQGAENLALGLLYKTPAGLATEAFSGLLKYFQMRFKNGNIHTATLKELTEKGAQLEPQFSKRLILAFYSTLNSETEEDGLRNWSHQLEHCSDGAADIYLRYGDSLLVQLLYAILLIDWTAYYLDNPDEIAF